MNKYNSEGYPDPTAYYGTKEIVREAAHLAGFEVVGRITFKDKKTGKEFR